MGLKRLALVQGPRSVELLLERLKDLPIDSWITYDDVSSEILSRNRIAHEARSPLPSLEGLDPDEIEQTAQRWASAWFEAAAVQDEDAALAFFACREFNFYFLVVLQAWAFLESLNRREGRCEIWTTRARHETDGPLGVRWSREDSPVFDLLNCPETGWSYDAHGVDLALQGTPVPAPAYRFRLKGWVRFFHGLISTGKSGDVLFSGNPALLDPVRDRLGSIGPHRSLKARNIAKSSDFVRTPDPRYATFSALWQGAHRPHAFDERRTHEALKAKGTFVFHGIDFLPVVWPRIRNFYRWYAPVLKRAYREIETTLRRIRPKYVVVDEDVVPFHKMLVHAAKRLGIRTLVVQHGMPGQPLGTVPLVAEQIAVWGQRSVDVFKEWGIGPSRILVTGCPKYDALCRKTENSPSAAKKTLCERYGWSSDKPVVMITPPRIRRSNAFESFLTDTPLGVILETTKSFIRLSKELPEIQFLFKLKFFNQGVGGRPFYESLAEPYGGLSANFVFESEGLAVDRMQGCDMVVNSTSSASLEAVILKKLFVHLNFKGNEIEEQPFPEYAGTTVRSYDQMRTVCLDLVSGRIPRAEWLQRQEAMARPFFYSRDSRSAERIAGFLDRQMSGAQAHGGSERTPRPSTVTA